MTKTQRNKALNVAAEQINKFLEYSEMAEVEGVVQDYWEESTAEANHELRGMMKVLQALGITEFDAHMAAVELRKSEEEAA